ncbi:very-long-chain (3R)-3-hydroxyacyl-CoA dehydratase [Silurus meridionalis]|nr:very-long-chain (3R)-3-hydroxyacyl-CoA dehydratase [Silurus meridionalis]
MDLQQEATESMAAAKRQKQCSVLGALRRHYLFIYSLLEFLGFSWTFSLLTANLILYGQAALYNAFSTCAPVLYGCQMLAVLEVMGRNVILFVVFGSLPEMQERSVVFWVFYLWSISEVFRADSLVFHSPRQWGSLSASPSRFDSTSYSCFLIQRLWNNLCAQGQARKTILDLRALRRHCITYRNATVMEITTWAQEYFQNTLSVNTIHRAICCCRLKLYRSKKKPYLNMIQKRRCFLWAKAHLKWIVAKGKTVLWSDE